MRWISFTVAGKYPAPLPVCGPGIGKIISGQIEVALEDSLRRAKMKALGVSIFLSLFLCSGLCSSRQFPLGLAGEALAAEGQEPGVKEGKVRRRQEREEERKAEVNLERRISIAFKATKFSGCLEKLAAKSGLNIIGSQQLLAAYGNTPISLTLKNLPIWSVLHVFADSCDLELINNQGVFMFRRQLKRDELWATMRLHIGVGEVQIRLLRGDVPGELKRNLIHRVLERGLHRGGPGDRPRHDQDEEGREEGDEGEQGRPAEVRAQPGIPVPGDVQARENKPDAF